MAQAFCADLGRQYSSELPSRRVISLPADFVFPGVGPAPGGAQGLFAVIKARAHIWVRRLRPEGQSPWDCHIWGMCPSADAQRLRRWALAAVARDPQNSHVGVNRGGYPLLWLLLPVSHLLVPPSPWPMFPGLRLQGLGAGKGSQLPRRPKMPCSTQNQTLSNFLFQKGWRIFVSPGICWNREVVFV